MSAETYLALPGDEIRLRDGPYTGRTGTVVSVHPDKDHSAEDSLVVVKLLNGRINSCYMGNLEMLPPAPQKGSLR